MLTWFAFPLKQEWKLQYDFFFSLLFLRLEFKEVRESSIHHFPEDWKTTSGIISFILLPKSNG